jgi:gliding motility-associated-like protein
VALTSPKNNTSHTAGSITLSANAADSDGTITKVEFFHGTTKLGEDLAGPYSFVWTNVKAGKYNLTARATDNRSGVTTSGIVTINVVNPNKIPEVQITGPANSARFNQGATVTINANAADSDGAITKVEFFQGTTKLGEDLSSPYSFTWANVKAGNYNLTAKATDNRNGVATSAAVAIAVIVPNKNPMVQITGPANNANFTQGASITINANASDSDGSITKVEFFRGTTKLGEDSSSPYSFVWSNVPAGTYDLTAKATDNRNGVAVSAKVTINVAIPNKKPLVKITSPANNAIFKEGIPIELSAEATDSDGSITKVEFFVGTTKIGEDTSLPFDLVWASPTPGTHTIKARATDNKGATATAQISIVVEEEVFVPVANAGNDISIELPENSVLLKGIGKSDNGEIQDYKWVQVEGPSDSKLTVATFDGEVVIENLEEGTYKFRLTVVDNKNMTATDEVIVRVYPLPVTSVELPRVFSPNGDGINDYWEWSNTEIFEDSRLMIFNRYGEKIYEVTSYNNTWDGSMNGSPLQEDAYYYVITSAHGELTGAVRIVR